MGALKTKKRSAASATTSTLQYQLELDSTRATPSLSCQAHSLIQGQSPKVPLVPMGNSHVSPQYSASTPSPTRTTNTSSPLPPPYISGNTPSRSAMTGLYERILPKQSSGTSSHCRESLTSANSSADQRERARKVSHSAIERRRRERMNDKIMQLKDIIPTCAHQENLHKLTILQSAIDYIQYLKNQVDSSEPGDDHPPLKHVAPSCSNSSSLVGSTPSLDGGFITTKNHQMTVDNLLT